MLRLRDALLGRVDAGGGAFVPYVTGGLPGVDAELLRGLEEAGADAIEVGIPFSDPVMDGPVIQEASSSALGAGASVRGVLASVAGADLTVPVAVMTYLNPVLAMGERAFLEEAVEAGVAGVIIPDLPVDEARDWIEACAERGVAPVLLAAPGTSPERLEAIARDGGGFVYCVSTYGVTGERAALSGAARELVGALRPLTDLPLLVGVGVSTPVQAVEACGFADGVVVGSALVRYLLEGDRSGALVLASRFREALDQAASSGPSEPTGG